MLQQYHWITGWWQPRCERLLSFVEDDKLRPEEDVTSGSRRCRSFLKFRSKIRNVRHQTSTFKMVDPAGTKTVEEAKKAERCQTQPERQTLLSLTPEETQKRLKRTKPRVVSYHQRMSWKVRRRSTIRRWFARRL